jgi:shikimate kinase
MLIILIGMCYSGKTTIGKILSRRIGLPCVDFADIFKQKFGKTELEYLSDHGKKYFKEAEHHLMKKSYDNQVLSLSGSSVYYEEEMLKLFNDKNVKVIFLNPSLDTINKRRKNEGLDRPILYPEGIKDFEFLYKQRYGLYTKYANVVINIGDDQTPQDVASEIIDII